MKRGRKAQSFVPTYPYHFKRGSTTRGTLVRVHIAACCWSKEDAFLSLCVCVSILWKNACLFPFSWTAKTTLGGLAIRLDWIWPGRVDQWWWACLPFRQCCVCWQRLSFYFESFPGFLFSRIGAMIVVLWKPIGKRKGICRPNDRIIWSIPSCVCLLCMWYARYRGGGRPDFGRHRGSRMRGTACHPDPGYWPAFLQQSSLDGQIQRPLLPTLLPIWAVPTLLQLLFPLHRPTSGNYSTYSILSLLISPLLYVFFCFFFKAD